MKLYRAAPLLWLAMLCVVAAAADDVTVTTREELIGAVRKARPGTKILLAPGTYAGGLSFDSLQGAAGQPIVLAAADPKDPPVIEGGGAGLHMTDPAYVELHHLVITKSRANGINLDDGGTFDSPAHHVTLKGVVIRDVGADANHDGLKLSGLNDFVIENCTIERWGKRGSGIDMVGCTAGIVRDCTFREGAEVSANGVQMKGGSRDITVRHCRFENAGGRAVNLGGSTGLAFFRPKPPGYEAQDITVEDCTIVGSMAPICFVGVDGALVRHNTIYRPTRWVVRILQENQDKQFAPSRNGRFENNIVFFRSDEVGAVVNVGGNTSPETFQFAGNLWYCADRPDRTQRLVQLPTKEKDGIYGQDPQFRNAEMRDLQLKPDSPARGAGPRASE
jgi:hypothetical protein